MKGGILAGLVANHIGKMRFNGPKIVSEFVNCALAIALIVDFHWFKFVWIDETRGNNEFRRIFDRHI